MNSRRYFSTRWEKLTRLRGRVSAVTGKLKVREGCKITAMGQEPTKIRVVIEYAGDNYGAYSPDLPGCVATGDTREEVEANMREAVSFHLEGLAEERDFLADPEVRRALQEAEAQIERGEGLSFEEAFGEE